MTLRFTDKIRCYAFTQIKRLEKVMNYKKQEQSIYNAYCHQYGQCNNGKIPDKDMPCQRTISVFALTTPSSSVIKHFYHNIFNTYVLFITRLLCIIFARNFRDIKVMALSFNKIKYVICAILRVAIAWVSIR